MDETYERLEAAIAGATGRKDGTQEELKEALRDLTEAERAALVPRIAKLLTYWRGQARRDTRYWIQEATAEGVLIACEPDSPALRRRITLIAFHPHVMEMLRDRRPPWAEDVMHALFASKAESDFVADMRWQSGELLRQMLGAPRPLDERNIVPLMVEFSRWGSRELPGSPQQYGSPAVGLNDDPDAEAIVLAVLAARGFGRVSNQYWTKATAVEDGWPRAIVELIALGRIDRDRVLRATLKALAAPDASTLTVTHLLVTLDLLAPTADEIDSNRSEFEALAASSRKNVATVAKRLLAR